MEMREINPPESNDYKDLSERHEMAKDLVKFARWKLERINENDFYYSLVGQARRVEDIEYSTAVLERCKRIAGRIKGLYWDEESKLGY